MGVPTSEVGYTLATTGRGDHEVHKGHVVALAQNIPRPTVVFETADNTERYIKRNMHLTNINMVQFN
jgi:PII-like signaling protein